MVLWFWRRCLDRVKREKFNVAKVYCSKSLWGESYFLMESEKIEEIRNFGKLNTLDRGWSATTTAAAPSSTSRVAPCPSPASSRARCHGPRSTDAAPVRVHGRERRHPPLHPPLAKGCIIKKISKYWFYKFAKNYWEKKKSLQFAIVGFRIESAC